MENEEARLLSPLAFSRPSDSKTFARARSASAMVPNSVMLRWREIVRVGLVSRWIPVTVTLLQSDIKMKNRDLVGNIIEVTIETSDMRGLKLECDTDWISLYHPMVSRKWGARTTRRGIVQLDDFLATSRVPIRTSRYRFDASALHRSLNFVFSSPLRWKPTSTKVTAASRR